MASQMLFLSPRDVSLRDVAEEFEGRFVAALNAGDIDALVSLFLPPLPIFFPGGIKVDAQYSDVHEGLAHFFKGMKELDIVRSESQISQVKQRDDTGAISYHVVTLMYDDAGNCLRTAIARRFLERTENGYRITMLDVQKPAIGVLNGNRKFKLIH